VLGDSLSAGYGIKVEQGWVRLLEQRLASEGYGYRVVNASVSGETTQGGLARLPRALETHKPAIVIVELGGNDGLRGLPLAASRDNLARIIEKARSRESAGIAGGNDDPA
jgi:acyl-CoA thioesterase-1